MRKARFVVTSLGMAAALLSCGVATAGLPDYQDPKQPVERRVADLLGRMSLDEKIMQRRGLGGWREVHRCSRNSSWRCGGSGLSTGCGLRSGREGSLIRAPDRSNRRAGFM